MCVTESPCVYLQGEATLFGMFYNMFFSFWGNLAGCLTVVELVHACSLFADDSPARNYAVHFSETKAKLAGVKLSEEAFCATGWCV